MHIAHIALSCALSLSFFFSLHRLHLRPSVHPSEWLHEYEKSTKHYKTNKKLQRKQKNSSLKQKQKPKLDFKRCKLWIRFNASLCLNRSLWLTTFHLNCWENMRPKYAKLFSSICQHCRSLLFLIWFFVFSFDSVFVMKFPYILLLRHAFLFTCFCSLCVPCDFCANTTTHLYFTQSFYHFIYMYF